MVCKYCGAFLSDDLKDCPVCGGILESDSAKNEDASEEVNSAPSAENVISPDYESDNMKPAKAKKNKTMITITVVLSVLLALAIAVCVLLSIDGMPQKIKGFFADVFSSTDSNKSNNPNDVVAEIRGSQLTNTKLNYYYYDVYETFYSMYGDQLETIITAVLNEGETVEDFIVELAIKEWVNTVVISEMAAKANYVLAADVQTEIDSLPQLLSESAVSAGYSSGDAFLKSLYGDFASASTYYEHYQETTYAYMYKMEYFNEKYYDYLDDIEGLDTFNYSVRHILFQPEDTEDADSWTEAENKAKEVYQTWLDGEATEESFGELAVEHSSDGSAIYGGLYEDIPEDYMVAEFNDWCFAEGRQTGDHGIIKTEYGYHIMYFVAYVNPNAYDSANSDLTAWISAEKNGEEAATYLDKVTIKPVEE